MTNDKDSTIIIDTGCANLSSVRYAFERIGADVEISDDIDKIKAATRIVLPGVGSAQAAMASLNDKALVDTIKSLTQPVLGVCLGMQIMTNSSTERGNFATKSDAEGCRCLGLIDTEICDLDSHGQPLPHMGWNQITPTAHPLFNGIAPGSFVYFVHSYRAPVSQYTIAQSEYGEPFSAAIAKDNFMGVQFHPEKSAAIGAQILKNFIKMTSSSLCAARREAETVQ